MLNLSMPVAPVKDGQAVSSKRAKGTASVFADILANLVGRRSAGDAKGAPAGEMKPATEKTLKTAAAADAARTAGKNARIGLSEAPDAEKETGPGLICAKAETEAAHVAADVVGKQNALGPHAGVPPPVGGKTLESAAGQRRTLVATEGRRGGDQPEARSEAKGLAKVATHEAAGSSVKGAVRLPVESGGGEKGAGEDREPSDAGARTRLRVLDLRAGAQGGAAANGASAVPAGVPPAVAEHRSGLDSGRETSLVFAEREASTYVRGARSETSAPQAAVPSRFHDELVNTVLQEARFILRGDNQGEIRLVLKPEHLGRVRIRLEMRDNHVAGRIFVENTSVRQMFEQSLGDIERSFRESGFEVAGFEVSVNDGGGERREKSRETPVIRLGHTAAAAPALTYEAAWSAYASNMVNVVV